VFYLVMKEIEFGIKIPFTMCFFLEIREVINTALKGVLNGLRKT
jgi:hypothetical protein